MDPSTLDINALVHQVRDLGKLARAAQAGWVSAIQDGNEPNRPDDDRQVLVFLNGHVDIHDMEGRSGGGWGIRFGYFDHAKGFWRAHGLPRDHVTHWRDLPAAPRRADTEA